MKSLLSNSWVSWKAFRSWLWNSKLRNIMDYNFSEIPFIPFISTVAKSMYFVLRQFEVKKTGLCALWLNPVTDFTYYIFLCHYLIFSDRNRTLKYLEWISPLLLITVKDNSDTLVTCVHLHNVHVQGPVVRSPVNVNGPLVIV